MVGFMGLIFTVLKFCYVFAQDPIVSLPQGRVVGIQVYTKSSLLPVEIYYGIPYATAPIGRFRFSAPERHPGWKRTFLAHRLPPQCPETMDVTLSSNNNNEDCLFLSIWTPRRADGESLPVVVILYSETWNKGGTLLPCEELAAEGVVVVLVSFRLSVLGFFTLRSAKARGNLALLDQYLALLWVKENIGAFGGDQASITLLGHSAGADSVLYHMVSPRSVGLFKRAVVMSPLQIWSALDEKRGQNALETEKISREIAKNLGCLRENDEDILNCLRSKSVPEILQVVSNSSWIEAMQPICDDFLPVMQQYLPNSISVAMSAATKQPIKQLDLLLGTTDLDSINLNDKKYRDLFQHSRSYLKEYVKSILIPQMLEMFSIDHSEAFPVLQQAIMWEYWREKTKQSIEDIENLSRIESSAVWGAGGALLAARLARQVSRLYVYRYSQPFGTNLQGEESNYTGAIHGTDLGALLGDTFILQVARRVSKQKEKQISSQLRQYVINFIKYGSPGSDEVWNQYKTGSAHVHDICNKEISSKRSATEDIAFWLQYLPSLSNLMNSPEHSHFTLNNGENRLRGGLFALCGVSVSLLLLLCVCAILFRKLQLRRFNVIDDHN